MEEPFRFLDLPAELRNEVYGLLVVQNRVIKRTIFSSSTLPTLPAITRVNRQVRLEARQVYYMQNTFECVPSVRCDLTTYRKFIRKADIPQCPDLKNNIKCMMLGASRRSRVSFFRMLRHFYMHGGNWPTTYGPWGDMEKVGVLIEQAQELKQAALGWVEAKKLLETHKKELKFFIK